MTDIIKKQFLSKYPDTGLMLIMSLGGFITGKLLLTAILFFDKSTNTYFPVAATLSGVMILIYTGLNGVAFLCYYFRFQIPMGITRKQFLASYYIVSFMEIAIGFLITLFLCWVDNKTNAYFYPVFTCEADILPWVLKYGMILATVVMLAAVFCGTLILKYGKKAGWILWALWMIGCFTLPRMSDAAPNTPAYLLKTAVQRFIHFLPSPLRIFLVAAAMIICIICSWLLLRRQQIN